MTLSNEATNPDRRRFLKTAGISLGYGALLGTGANLGIGYLERKLVGAFAATEREIRELTLNLRALSGAIEDKISKETQTLKETYNSGKLGTLEELGIASAQDLKDIEQIIENSEKIVEHYDVLERLRIYKDRIDNKLLSIDSKVEDSVPGVNGVGDLIRFTMGKDTGKKGQDTRAALKRRVSALCQIYDTNENNMIAEGKVLEKLNQYLSGIKDMPLEERGLYMFLRDQYATQGSKEHLKTFIKNFDSYSQDQEVLLRLRAYITEIEGVYGKVVESKDYALKLQDALKKGIKLKEDVRSKSAEEFAEQERAINSSIYELKSIVDGTIAELKQKGYDIETREEYMGKSVVGDAVSAIVDPFRIAAGVIIGLYAAGTHYLGRRTKDQLNAVREELKRGETHEN